MRRIISTLLGFTALCIIATACAASQPATSENQTLAASPTRQTLVTAIGMITHVEFMDTQRDGKEVRYVAEVNRPNRTQIGVSLNKFGALPLATQLVVNGPYPIYTDIWVNRDGNIEYTRPIDTRFYLYELNKQGTPYPWDYKVLAPGGVHIATIKVDGNTIRMDLPDASINNSVPVTISRACPNECQAILKFGDVEFGIINKGGSGSQAAILPIAPGWAIQDE